MGEAQRVGYSVGAEIRFFLHQWQQLVCDVSGAIPSVWWAARCMEGGS